MKITLLTLFTSAALVAAQFPSGLFNIVSQANMSLRWGIQDNSTWPGAFVVLSSEDGPAEFWEWNSTTGHLTNVNTGDANLVVTAGNGTLTQKPVAAEPNDLGQIWTYGVDTQAIRSLADDLKCASLNGSAIIMQTCNLNATEQRWEFVNQ